MKRFWAIILAMLMVLSLAACGGTTTPSSSTPSDSSTPSSPSGEVYKLIVSTHTPANGTATQVLMNYLNEIETRSNGRIDFEVYTDGTLAAVDGVIDAVTSGVADIAVVNPARQSGRLGLAEVAGLPGVFNNTWEGSKAFQELYDTVPAMGEELAAVGLKLVGVQLIEGVTIISKKEINSIYDLQGKKVISSTPFTTSIFTQIGAIPLGMANTEAYEALSKGTADVVASTSISGGAGFGLHEVADYVYHLNLGAGAMLYCMNEDAWNRLPEDLQAIINEVAHDFQPDNVYTVYCLELGKDPSSLETFEQAGVTIIEPTAEQVQDFQDNLAIATWTEWAAEKDAAGKAGTEVLNAFVALCDKHVGTCPNFTK